MNAPAFETNLKYGSISVTNDTHRTIRVLRYIHSCFDRRVKSSDPEAEELTMLSDPRVITMRRNRGRCPSAAKKLQLPDVARCQ